MRMLQQTSLLVLSLFLACCSFVDRKNECVDKELANILEKKSIYEGVGPAGVLSKHKDHFAHFLEATRSSFNNQNGLGFYYQWDDAIFCVVLEERKQTGIDAFELGERMPELLFNEENGLQDEVNNRWKIASWSFTEHKKHSD